MDSSSRFSQMLNEAIKQYPIDFIDFDKTKNVQDQLQEMVKSDPYFAWNYIGMLGRFADKNIIYTCGFDSMEQLWLAFVMKEKFQKLWDEEKQNWIEMGD